jgi:hypothetical protein
MWDACTNDILQRHGMEVETVKCHFLSVLVMLETVFNSFSHVCNIAGGVVGTTGHGGSEGQKGSLRYI